MSLTRKIWSSISWVRKISGLVALSLLLLGLIMLIGAVAETFFNVSPPVETPTLDELARQVRLNRAIFVVLISAAVIAEIVFNAVSKFKQAELQEDVDDG